MIETMLKELVAISAPSFNERKRALYIAKLFENEDVNVTIDEVNNCIVTSKRLADRCTLINAHLDTVFSDESISVTENADNIYAPGVGDDTANVCVLALTMKELLKENIFPDNVIFAFNSCEEGLGNLIGINKILDTYGDRIERHIALDLTYNSIINRAVGSVRRRVTIETTGGHSYGDFGNASAIAVAADMIASIYAIDTVAFNKKTTYNVGKIEGGTSVNTIASKCTFMYEVRSEDMTSLEICLNAIHDIIYGNDNVKISEEEIGNRPCSDGSLDAKIDELTENVLDVVSPYVGRVEEKSGSTDCNASVARNIPAVCIGCYNGGGEHTYSEWVEKASLNKGLEICKKLVMSIR